jgi:Arc/MetJ-type ribon-helix-helix transcriptional regulator
MTTVRLPIEIEQKLEILSRTRHKSKTEVIKEALENLYFQAESEKGSYELGEDFFGIYGSGNGSLSVDYKKLLKGKLNAKNNPH